MWEVIRTNVVSAIIPGIISGIIASLMFALFLLLIKPKVKIASKMAMVCHDSGMTLRIKIVNQTRSMLTNVRYTLYYSRVLDDGLSRMIEIPPRKSPMMYIDKYSKKDKEAKYAVRLSYDVSFNLQDIEPNQKFFFVLMADHVFSNTTVCLNREYNTSDIMEGIYEIGPSTRINVNYE